VEASDVGRNWVFFLVKGDSDEAEKAFFAARRDMKDNKRCIHMVYRRIGQLLLSGHAEAALLCQVQTIMFENEGEAPLNLKDL
jgi:hypothetical protein